MPRGKRKAPEDMGSPEPKRRKPQSAPHKRGGTHRVKDEHRTGTHWDTLNHRDLLHAIKSPSRVHLYFKDMRKHQMSQALAADDRRRKEEEQMKEKEMKRKQEEAQRRKKEEEEANSRREQDKQRRRAERDERRQAGEDVEADSETEEELRDAGIEMIRTLLDGSSYASTTESETTIPSMISPIRTAQRLRIFEWPYPELPSSRPPSLPSSITDSEEREEELLPLKLPYTVMKLVTTGSKETLELPGRDYSPADLVPKLRPETILAARNGTRVGALRNATIESGKDWAKRTRVQGWNGRMYFDLPPRTSTVPLADVYTKWHRKRRGKTQTYEYEYKTSRTIKQQAKYEDKKQMMLEIYASSEYRPPICYIPAYLGDPWDLDGEYPASLDNLFYVRFPGMHLPHYFFWTEPDEWQDPTTPNPEYRGAKEIDRQREQHELQEHSQLLEEVEKRKFNVPLSRDGRPYALDKTKTRVKKAGVPRKFQEGVKQPRASRYKTALWTAERLLYRHGLSKTLVEYRNKWLEDGKTEHWEHLIDNMPKLYPSGNLPDNPPVHVDQVPKSLAEKIASIQVPSPERPVSPIRGDEPWTRDDDAYWNVVDAVQSKVREGDIQQQLLRAVEELDVVALPPTTEELQQRRSSAPSPTSPSGDFRGLDTWLNTTSPSFAPPDSHMPATYVGEALRAFERQEWEERFEKWALNPAPGSNMSRKPSRARRPSQAVPELITQIESMPVAELKWQLYTLMDERMKRDDVCEVCLQPLPSNDSRAVSEHYQSHLEEADAKCPFCGMQWGVLDSHWKASHILHHERDDYPLETERLYRRRSSSVRLPSRSGSKSSSSKGIRGIWKESSKPQPRRSSKVTFAPVTVEKRIAYNDDTGIDADISSLGIPSPKKSSLKLQSRRAASKNFARKPSLRLDTFELSPAKTKAKRGRAADSSGSEFDPSGACSEEHIPSPYLHSFVRYARDDPRATYKLRKQSLLSTSSYDLESRQKGKPMKATGASKATKVKGAAKSEAKETSKRKVIDSEYKDVHTSVSSAPLPAVVSRGRGKRKAADTTYRALPSSTSTSSNEIPAEPPKKKRRVADPTYRGLPPPSASEPESPVKRRRRPLAKRTTTNPARVRMQKDINTLQEVLLELNVASGAHQPSTASSTSSESRKRRESETTNREAPSTALSTTSERSPVKGGGKKKGWFLASLNALFRRDSQAGSSWDAEDYIPFGDEPVPDLGDEDALMGNPFAPPTKKGKRKTEVAPVRRTITKGTSGRISKKPKSPTRAERAANLAKSTELEETTLSGRPHIEPSLVAPGKRTPISSMGRRRSTPASATTSSSSLGNTIRASTTSSATFSDLSTSSTAAQASPYILQARATGATTDYRPAYPPSPVKFRAPSITSLASAPVKRLQRLSTASYDVPFSETRPIVPPNTPATHILGRKSPVSSVGGSASRSGVDAGELSSKIGRVKTTRGGLVRELTVGMKGKSRGRSAAKGTEKRKDEIRKTGKRVVKKRSSVSTMSTAPTLASKTKGALAKTPTKRKAKAPPPSRRATRAASKAETGPKMGTQKAAAKPKKAKESVKKVATGRGTKTKAATKSRLEKTAVTGN